MPFQSMKLASLFALLTFTPWTPILGQDKQAAPPDAARHKHALLVGCTVYPNLDKQYHLAGPANDVVLARNILVERFGFPDANVVTLCDDLAKDDLAPTRANIEREWKNLAQKAARGDQIVVLMAGHGTKTPQLNESDDDPEPDGMDEMFLPRDVGHWDDTAGEVENGIKDDDIRAWIAAIRDRGADLFVIIDACHSGTMTRGAGEEVKRELRPEALGVPQTALDKAAQRSVPGDEDGQPHLFSESGERTRGGSSGAADEPVLVALYAAQSIEPTVEKKMPRRGEDRKYYGLMTYTMHEILSQSESPLTYRDLVHKIHRQYVKWGRVWPTPVLEGNGLDREVLGLSTFPDRPDMLVTGTSGSGFMVNAGALNGLTENSILAVYPPAGSGEADTLIGHVRVLEDDFTAVDAAIEPCEYNGIPAPAPLAAGQRCKTVFVDLGDNRLRICVDTHTDQNEEVSQDEWEDLSIDLEDFADENEHLVELVDGPEDADWLLRYDALDSHKLLLAPASGWHGKQEGDLPPLYGPAPAGDGFLPWMISSLTKISRVQSLLRISASAAGGFDDSSDLIVEIVRYKDSLDREGEPVKFENGGIKLYNGDRVGFRVRNDGDEPLDVTILMVDSAYGIYPLYPRPGQINRVYPKDEVVQRGRITADTTGLEHLIVLGVKAQAVNAPMSFACLAQPSIERSRAVGGKSLSSPLGKLYQSALYGKGKTRGFASEEVDSFVTSVTSWTTVPDRR